MSKIVEITLDIGASVGKIEAIRALRNILRTDDVVPGLSRTKELVERAQTDPGVRVRLNAEQMGLLYIHMILDGCTPIYWYDMEEVHPEPKPDYIDFTDGGGVIA